jgi:membrane protein DedA with SNARE-associated domain
MMNVTLVNGLALFLLASFHEDVAVLSACYLSIERGMALREGLAIVYVGTLVNNYVIYGLGMLARRLPGLRRRLIHESAQKMRRRLGRHLAKTLIACRFLPGSLSPVMLGCGWLGVPFARFALTIAVSAALYLVLVAVIACTLGETVLKQLSGYAWAIAIGLAAIAVVVVALWKALSRR